MKARCKCTAHLPPERGVEVQGADGGCGRAAVDEPVSGTRGENAAGGKAAALGASCSGEPHAAGLRGRERPGRGFIVCRTPGQRRRIAAGRGDEVGSGLGRRCTARLDQVNWVVRQANSAFTGRPGAVRRFRADSRTASGQRRPLRTRWWRLHTVCNLQYGVEGVMTDVVAQGVRVGAGPPHDRVPLSPNPTT